MDPRAGRSLGFAVACGAIGWVVGGVAVAVAAGLGVLLSCLLLDGMIAWRSREATPLLPSLVSAQKWVGVMHHVVLQLVEVLAVVGVALWTLVGAVSYLRATDWTLEGLLTLLDGKWKGVLILSGILLLRSIQEVLARTRRFSVPWLDQVAQPQDPAEEPTIVEPPPPPAPNQEGPP